MRSVALAALLTLLAVAPAAAGIETWGFRAGWSGARLGGDGGSVIAPDYRSDFTATWFVSTRLNPWLAFQPELGWVSKGGQDDFQLFSFPSPTEVTYTDFTSSTDCTTSRCRCCLRFELPAMGPLRPYALAGTARWRGCVVKTTPR